MAPNNRILAIPSPGRSVIQRTLPGASWLMAERVVSLVSALAVSMAITRHLGPEQFGTLAFVLSFAAILLPVSAAGLAEAVTKELLDRPAAQGVTMGTVLAIRKGVGLVVIGLFGLFAWLGPFPDDQTRLYAFALVALGIAGDASVLRNWFVANDELPRFAALSIIRTALFAFARLALVAAGAPLVAFVIVAGLELASATPFAWLAWRLADAPRPALGIDRSIGGALLRKNWPLALSSVAAVLNLKLDIALLGWLATPAETGLYSAAVRLSEIWYVVPALLMTAMFPSLIETRRNSPAQYGALLQASLDTLCAAAVLMALATVLGAPMIVPLLFGEAFAPSAPILVIHVWAGVFVFMRTLASKWLIAEDLLMFSLVSHGAGAVANVALNLLLIPRYGGEGAAIATLISYGVSSYLAFALFPQTRQMFVRMSAAFLWPLRMRALVAQVRRT